MTPKYNRYRAAVLSFLYEKQRKPVEGAAKPVIVEEKQKVTVAEPEAKTTVTDEQAA